MAARLQPVMLRLVDDFLILSPSRAAAEALVSRIMQGVDPCHADHWQSLLWEHIKFELSDVFSSRPRIASVPSYCAVY